MMTVFRRKVHWRHFETEMARYTSLQRHAAGVRIVPIERIVGSVGRSIEGMPGTGLWHVSSTELRYRQVRELMRRGHNLPAVELYQLHDAYYVVDGHHRIAAARSLGWIAVDAEVTEFRPVGAQVHATVA